MNPNPKTCPEHGSFLNLKTGLCARCEGRGVRTAPITRERMEELAKDHTDVEIGEIINRSHLTVATWRRRWGIAPYQKPRPYIPAPPPTPRAPKAARPKPKPKPRAEQTRRKLVEIEESRELAKQGWPAIEIAARFGVSRHQVLEKVPESRENGVEWRRVLAWAMSKHPELLRQIQGMEL